MTVVEPASPAAAARPPNLLSRAAGVLVSPGDTYAALAAHPRVLGALLLAVVISVAANGAFLATDVGRDALLDQQFEVMESFNFEISDEQYAQIEARMANAAYFSAGSQLVALPLVMCVEAGILLGVFNVVLGGDASFKQVMAIVAHASLILSLQAVFVLPLNYARGALVSATSLSVFFPMLEESGFLARLLGLIDLFWIWWVVSLGIGLGVLYKRSTGPILGGLLACYAVIALAIATVLTVVLA